MPGQKSRVQHDTWGQTGQPEKQKLGFAAARLAKLSAMGLTWIQGLGVTGVAEAALGGSRLFYEYITRPGVREVRNKLPGIRSRRSYRSVRSRPSVSVLCESATIGGGLSPWLDCSSTSSTERP